MLFLLTRRLNPAINLVLGAAFLAVGLIFSFNLLIVSGALALFVAGLRTVRRIRGDGGQAGASR